MCSDTFLAGPKKLWKEKKLQVCSDQSVLQSCSYTCPAVIQKFHSCNTVQFNVALAASLLLKDRVRPFS